jgi:hypothetical protein
VDQGRGFSAKKIDGGWHSDADLVHEWLKGRLGKVNEKTINSTFFDTQKNSGEGQLGRKLK